MLVGGIRVAFQSRFTCLSSLTSRRFLAHADTAERHSDLLRLREWLFTLTALAPLGPR